MSNLIWPQAFPGGVTDRLGRHALIRDASGHCALLRLADGALLWRSAEPARPLLLDDSLAIGLQMAPPRVVAWSLQGDVRWQSPVLPWPGWATRPAGLNSASDLHAGWLDGDALISWRLRAPRGGGAGRGPTFAPPTMDAGAVCLQRDTGALSEVTDWVQPPEEESQVNDAVVGSDDPRVLAQRVLAGIQYTLLLHQEGGQSRTALVAHDAQPPGLAGRRQIQAGPAGHDPNNPGAGDARWTCWLDGFEPRRPPPHRP